MKNKRLIKLIFLLTILLSLGVTVFSLSSIYFRGFVKLPARPSEPSTVAALIVNGSPITVKEYENAVEYYKEFWGVRIVTEEINAQIKDDLIERNLVSEWAKQENISVSEDDVLEMGKELYGENASDLFMDNPYFESEARYEVYKSSLRKNIEAGEILADSFEDWLDKQKSNARIVNNIEEKEIKFQDSALIVNDFIITREEFENALKYYRDYWEVDTSDPDVRREIKNILIERALVESWARDQNINLSHDEIVEKSKQLFAGVTPSIKAYPDIEAQARYALLIPHIQSTGVSLDEWSKKQLEEAKIVDKVY